MNGCLGWYDLLKPISKFLPFRANPSSKISFTTQIKKNHDNNPHNCKTKKSICSSHNCCYCKVLTIFKIIRLAGLKWNKIKLMFKKLRAKT